MGKSKLHKVKNGRRCAVFAIDISAGEFAMKASETGKDGRLVSAADDYPAKKRTGSIRSENLGLRGYWASTPETCFDIGSRAKVSRLLELSKEDRYDDIGAEGPCRPQLNGYRSEEIR